MAVGPRALVVDLPSFRLERCGFDADEPAALVGEVKNATRIVALTPRCAHEGLSVGMTASEARALLPTVMLEVHDPAAEAEDHRALLRAFEALSDQVHPLGSDCVFVGIGSTSRLFGGEREAARVAVELAESFGHRARAAIADHPVAAMAVAASLEASDVEVVPRGGGRAALAELPMAYLRPEPQLLDDLRSIGVVRIGQFADLDPASVAGRYPDSRRLHQVARGHADARDHLYQKPPDGLPAVQAALAGSTTLGELQFVLPDLISQLCAGLASRDLAAVRMRLVLHLELRQTVGVRLRSETIRIGRPSRSPATLERLIRGRLERLVLDAPAERIEVLIDEAAPDTGWQPGLSSRTQAREPLPDLLARLADQLGDASLFSACLVDSWRPEASWQAAPFLTGKLISSGSGRREPEDPVEVLEAFERDPMPPRPTVLLPRPLQIVVAPFDETPEWVELDRHPRARVVRCSGPERLFGHWWAPSEIFERAYWAIQMSSPASRSPDRIAWIFEEHGRWYLHGWFD